MSTWDIHLVFSDEKSNKFWRARQEGEDLVVNWGRVGSDGQTQVKNLGSEDKSKAELEKLARTKRKKGYEDAQDGPEPPEETEAPEPEPIEVNEVELILDAGSGRAMRVRLELDGEDALRTTVVETFEDQTEARQAFERVRRSMKESGYREAS